MRKPILVISAALALCLSFDAARSQGFPGATVGIPLGSPDAFGSMTRQQVEPPAEPSVRPEAARPDRRAGPRSRRHAQDHRRAAPKRPVPRAAR